MCSALLVGSTAFHFRGCSGLSLDAPVQVAQLANVLHDSNDRRVFCVLRGPSDLQPGLGQEDPLADARLRNWEPDLDAAVQVTQLANVCVGELPGCGVCRGLEQAQGVQLSLHLGHGSTILRQKVPVNRD